MYASEPNFQEDVVSHRLLGDLGGETRSSPVPQPFPLVPAPFIELKRDLSNNSSQMDISPDEAMRNFQEDVVSHRLLGDVGGEARSSPVPQPLKPSLAELTGDDSINSSQMDISTDEAMRMLEAGSSAYSSYRDEAGPSSCSSSNLGSKWILEAGSSSYPSYRDEAGPSSCSSSNLGSTRYNKLRGCHNPYTLEHDAAMRKGVEDYGLDFERIKEENKDLFDSRTAVSLRQRFRKLEPDKFAELKGAATPREIILNEYTPEEDAALKKGVDDYGLDFERIKDDNKDLFEGRTVYSLSSRFYRLEPDKYRELMAAAPRKMHPNEYTAEQDAALRKGFDDYGLDFERIKEENKDLLYNRSVRSINYRIGRIEPDRYRELKAAIPRKLQAKSYTPEQDAALRKGVADYGLDFERIKNENKDIFERRTVDSLKQRFGKLKEKNEQDAALSMLMMRG